MSRHATRHFQADRLRAARKLRGFTAEGLAREIDVTLRTVQRWEDPDGSQPSGGDLVALARALSCNPEFFYGAPANKDGHVASNDVAVTTEGEQSPCPTEL